MILSKSEICPALVFRLKELDKKQKTYFIVSQNVPKDSIPLE